MADSRRPVVPLSDVHLAELLSRVEDVEQVRLRLSVAALDYRATVATLGMDALEARIQQAYLFDTRDLALEHRGILLRARRVDGMDDEVNVTLRPPLPDELPDTLRRSPSLRLDVDATANGFVVSASLRATPKTDVRTTAERGRPPRALFSKDQRALIAAHAPEGVGIADLSTLGPLFGLALRFSPPKRLRSMRADLWLYPDSSPILEFSLRCAPKEVERMAAEARAFLVKRGVDISGDPYPRTRKAALYFAKRLTPNRKDLPS